MGLISEFYLRDRRKIFPLILSELERINNLIPLKLLENHMFPDDCRGNRSYLISLNSLNNKRKIWQQSLKLVEAIYVFWNNLLPSLLMN